MKAADPKRPLDDYSKSDPNSSGDGESLREYLAKGSKWSRKSSSSIPTRLSRASLKLRQKGRQSLIGIYNKDTISKDNTLGDKAQMDDLLASFGRKVMGIKHQEQHEETSPDLAGPGHSQINGPVYKVFQTSNRRPRYSSTYVRDSYHDFDEDDDEIIEVDGRTYVLPKQSSSDEYDNKINAARRYIQGPGYVPPVKSRTERYDAKINQAAKHVQTVK
ncbi:vegetative cell wall protein gp1 [Fusarium austroafricanum]|uniref:Vegetative cell wall protein gp1 n=1 Tax=Fusarium austroafricanum TaxID=2364996 RepID=A0A8H4KFA1_9HYPO|nr:vegetative cell wall protein gp1 [Fusarium austroafricanum]